MQARQNLSYGVRCHECQAPAAVHDASPSHVEPATGDPHQPDGSDVLPRKNPRPRCRFANTHAHPKYWLNVVAGITSAGINGHRRVSTPESRAHSQTNGPPGFSSRQDAAHGRGTQYVRSIPDRSASIETTARACPGSRTGPAFKPHRIRHRTEHRLSVDPQPIVRARLTGSDPHPRALPPALGITGSELPRVLGGDDMHLGAVHLGEQAAILLLPSTRPMEKCDVLLQVGPPPSPPRPKAPGPRCQADLPAIGSYRVILRMPRRSQHTPCRPSSVSRRPSRQPQPSDGQTGMAAGLIGSPGIQLERQPAPARASAAGMS